jgi:hypothetical protein
MAYPTNTNNRVFYATQAVAIGDHNATGVLDSWPGSGATALDGNGELMVMHGLQSIGVSTNFNLDPIFELGQLSLYENYEEIPDIELTFEKVLDGYTLTYHAGTVSAANPTLTGRANARADIRAVIGYDTESAIVAGGSNSGLAELYCPGMYLSSESISLSTDGNFTESTTFVGNDKRWLSDAAGLLIQDANGTLADVFDANVFGSDTPQGVGNSVLRRQNVVVGSTGIALGAASQYFRTVVPDFIEGTSTGAIGIEGSAAGTGLNQRCSYIPAGGGVYVNSFSVSVDLGRESINQLGKKAPYTRYVNFPVEVTSEIEVTATAGDNIDAYEEGQPSLGGKNLTDHSLQFVTDDSMVVSLGNKNKVTSVSYGGGDAGGGNATNTYSMSNYNDFVLLHSGDPISLSGSSYFKNWF